MLQQTPLIKQTLETSIPLTSTIPLVKTTEIKPKIKKYTARNPKRKYNQKKAGRPSSINRINLKRVEALVKSGFTNQQIADFFDLTITAFDIYKQRNQKFFNTIKDWKLEANYRVEKSLYQRAIGYEYDEVVYEQSKTGMLGVKLTQDNVDEIKAAPCYKVRVITKQVAPDVLAQIFWLKNRKPVEWREKHEVEHTGEINLVKMVSETNDLGRKFLGIG